MVALGCAAIVGLATAGAIERIAGGSATEPAAAMIAPGAVVLVAAALGVVAGWQIRSSGELHDYCYYGSVSSAEIGGCLDHVNTDRIDRLGTDAALFARGTLNSCLYDAGPYCAQALDARTNPPDEPNP